MIFVDGTTTLGTVALNGSSQALFATSALSVGSHSITAMYVGNANYAGSTSPVLTQVVNASTGIGTTTSLASSANPSSDAQSVVFTASVVGAGGNVPAPTGIVTFVNGTTTLGISCAECDGASISSTAGSLTPGAYSITAIYGGDGTYAASASTALTADCHIASIHLAREWQSDPVEDQHRRNGFFATRWLSWWRFRPRDRWLRQCLVGRQRQCDDAQRS